MLHGAATLPWRTAVAYVAPAAGASGVATLFTVMYANFATDRLGVSALTLSGILAAAKLWSAFADPLVGSWSDRTRARIGRRRAWLLASALPFAGFTLMTWAPPPALSGFALAGWVTVGVIGYYTALTACEVPHAAWGVELTHDPPSRNRLFGLKYGVRAIGIGLASTLGVALVADPATGREGARLAALVGGGGTALLLLASLPFLPRERADYQARGGVSMGRALADVWRHRNARLLLIVFFVEAFGLGGLTVLIPYVTRYVMHTPEKTSALLAVYVGSTFLAVPVWVWLARRFEKRSLWTFAMGQAAVGFGSLIFVGEGDWLLMAVSALVAGSAQACGQSIGVSLKADVIDVDELRTGERKEGAYFAAWSFVQKLGNLGLASSALAILHFAGYVPNVEQTPLVKATLVLLMGGMPLLGYAAGVLLFQRFTLNAAEHARVRAALDARAAPGASA
jgi:GPH family glycoside/pentoside/hexuronide:cation symporter